jgi:predicted  nucleic acid-binding Zn-ribbon protein
MNPNTNIFQTDLNNQIKNHIHTYIKQVALLNQTQELIIVELIKKDTTIKSMEMEIQHLKTSFNNLNNQIITIENKNRELNKTIEELKKTIEEKEKIINECVDTIFIYEMKCSSGINKIII